MKLSPVMWIPCNRPWPHQFYRCVQGRGTQRPEVQVREENPLGKISEAIEMALHRATRHTRRDHIDSLHRPDSDIFCQLPAFTPAVEC